MPCKKPLTLGQSAFKGKSYSTVVKNYLHNPDRIIITMPADHEPVLPIDKDPESQRASGPAKYKVEEVAAGLFWRSRKTAFFLYLLTVVPAVTGFLTEPQASSSILGLNIADRLIKLAVLWLIGISAISAVAPKGNAARASAGLTFFAAGLAAGIVIMSPAHLLNILWQNMSLWPFLALAAGLWIVGYFYFFYFFPFFLNIRSPTQVLSLARTYTRHDIAAPLKTSMAPAGLMYLIMALAAAPFPDGRVFHLEILSVLASGLYWFLSSYLAVAFGIAFLPDSLWRKLNFDPYRQSRLTTLSINAPKWLTEALKPKNGAIMLAAAILVGLANQARLAEMAPAPQITVDALRLEHRSLSLSLTLQDHKFHFRGFRPFLFRLAGETKRIISATPQAVNVPGHPGDARFRLPRENPVIRIEVQFETDRNESDLRQLNDLFLWYAGVKILPLDVHKTQSSPGQEQTAAPPAD